MSNEPQNRTFILSHGRIISKIITLAKNVRASRLDVYLAVGSNVRDVLDRASGGSGTFDGLRYVQDMKASPYYFELKANKPKKEGEK